VSSLALALRRHRRLLTVVILGAILLSLVVLIWFEPQKLFIDEEVDEAAPRTASGEAGAQGEDEQQPSSGAPDRTLGSGEFKPLAHHANGRASILKLADGRRFLRFEDFEVENGPDLKVYLSAAPGDAPEDALIEDYVDLGDLKGNLGDQNYAIPADTDLSKYRTAVVWCRRFSVGFAAADIS
jgi:hypothetical protein